MWLLIIGGIMSALGLGLSIFALFKIKHQKQIDLSIEAENRELKEKKTSLVRAIEILCTEKSMIEENIKEKQEILIDFEETLKQSFVRYAEALEAEYSKVEIEYDDLKNCLYGGYEKLQDKLLQEKFNTEKEINIACEKLKKEIEQVETELKNLQNTRSAAIQAKLREKEMELKAEFYSLHLSSLEKDTITLIEELKPRLPDPRVLCMLIWTTFYQKQMSSLCSNILGPNVVCGIYKISNKNTGMCYIGQAVNVADRWKQHVKCGLGIDTPAQNKLYKAMLAEGVTNFTFELLEACDSAQLNEKERKYIELYQSNEYGYNSTKGNK